MIAVRTIVIVAGAGLVAWTLLSAIRTVILPRSAQSVITGVVFRSIRVPFRWLANEGKTFEFRDRVMALFAPVALVVLPGVWLALITTGYMAMFWSLDTRSIGDAFHLSGSSLTTLGFAAADGFWERLLAFTEAAFGLFTATLVITYLPSMYTAFSRREAHVGLLEVRAGSPPSAAEFIIRHYVRPRPCSHRRDLDRPSRVRRDLGCAFRRRGSAGARSRASMARLCGMAGELQHGLAVARTDHHGSVRPVVFGSVGHRSSASPTAQVRQEALAAC